MKKLHELALISYNANYNEFLNEIYRIYSEEELKGMEDFLLKYKSIHFQIIKYLYQGGRSLENEPLKIILKFPKLLDFETKKFLFHQHPKIRKAHRGYRFNIEVTRENIFQESYNQVMARTPNELQGRLQIAFFNEPGIDAGGVAR